MNLCKDCRHSIQDGAATSWECAKTKRISLVDGSTHYFSCSLTRSEPTLCGADGLWFEPHPDLVDAEPPDQYNRDGGGLKEKDFLR